MDERVRIVFELERDEDGYPEFATEGLGALVLPDGRYKIDNIPFYAYAVALGDIVAASEDPQTGVLKFEAVLEPSSNNTVRVAVPGGKAPAVRDRLRAMGCDSEGITERGLFSVNIPGNRLTEALAYLDESVEADLLGWEEGVIRD